MIRGDSRARQFGLMTSAAILPLLVAGCGTQIGTFGSDGFHHTKLGYTVRYGEPKQRQILSADWRLDNFQISGRQAPPQEPEAKKGTDYMTHVHVDLDDDGTPDLKEQLPLYDLRFEHVNTSAAIWLRTFPVARAYAQKDLGILLDSYANAVNDGRYVAVDLLNRRLVVSTARSVARVRSSCWRQISGYHAIDGTIEIADAEQVKIAPETRRELVRLILLRTPSGWRPYGSEWRAPWPVMMVIGYAARPADFERNMADFDHFVDRVDLRTIGNVLLRSEAANAAPAGIERCASPGASAGAR